MHYFVDNMFRQDKSPYCSNCSRDADCIALLLVRTPRGPGVRWAGGSKPLQCVKL